VDYSQQLLGSGKTKGSSAMPAFVTTGIGLAFAAAVKAYKSAKQKHEKNLAENLKRIAGLLGSVNESLKKGIVPRKQSYELAAVINFVNEGLDSILFPEPDLHELFATRLPRIGYLMREADVFIDGKPRSHAHTYMLKARDGDYKASIGLSAIKNASLEIERAIGELEGSAFIRDQSSKAKKAVVAKAKRKPKK
jgi:hypothetical protein